jgi:hypothetical protein
MHFENIYFIVLNVNVLIHIMSLTLLQMSLLDLSFSISNGCFGVFLLIVLWKEHSRVAYCLVCITALIM